MTITIRETIHHGNYHNVQESTGDTIPTAFSAALAASPYNSNVDGLNKYRGRCLQSLMKRCHGELGWAEYEVLGADGNPINPRPRWGTG